MGFTFGGPVKNQSVFFTSYEVSKVLDSALIDTLVPVQQNSLFALPRPTHPELARLEDVDLPALAAEVAPYIQPVSTPQKNTSFVARVDHPFSVVHNISAVYQAGRLVNLRQFGGGNRLADALQGRRRNSDAISVSDNYVFSSRIVNQLRMQYSRLVPSFKTDAAGKPVVLIALNDPEISGTLVAGSSTSGGSDRREDRFQLQNVLSLVSGGHSPVRRGRSPRSFVHRLVRRDRHLQLCERWRLSRRPSFALRQTEQVDDESLRQLLRSG